MDHGQLQTSKNKMDGKSSLPGGMCLRSSCTLGRHPVRAVATCFRRSSSDSLPSPGWLTSSDVCNSDDTSAMVVPAFVSVTVCMSMTWPQVSTKWTVLASTTGTVGPKAAGAGRPPPPPFRCGHGTLPRGMLL